MAIHLPPSLQHRHALVWSGDPALAVPGPSATEADRQAWPSRLETARETGKWSDVIRGGEAPTIFLVKPIPGTRLRELADDVAAGRIGAAMLCATCFRVGIKAIENPDMKVEVEADRRFGEIAKESLVDDLDSVHPGIVAELGMLLFNRAGVPPGK